MGILDVTNASLQLPEPNSNGRGTTCGDRFLARYSGRTAEAYRRSAPRVLGRESWDGWSRPARNPSRRYGGARTRGPVLDVLALNPMSEGGRLITREEHLP
jgi:hypothetical protein